MDDLKKRQAASVRSFEKVDEKEEHHVYILSREPKRWC